MSEHQSDNVYAKDVNDDIVFIGDVERGRKGYFCLGCSREMQAVKPTKREIRAYFRHHVESGSNKGKCTYSDETYRHKLAKEFLQMQKKVKVPSVYKYPPHGQEGISNFLTEARFIEAHSVGIEKTFYENENGEVKSGTREDADGKYLLIRPDVTFFDKDDNPILFIELVATHKLTDDKKIKIKRLGVDAIQIAVPKDSQEAISESLNHTNHTKWIYNREQEDARYVPIPISNSEGVQPIDEVQRRFFEESFKCRAAQIGNFIQAIRKCLESEYYRQIEQFIRSEISRVEKNTREHQDRWDRICNNRREELVNRYSGRRGQADGLEARLRERDRRFREEKTDLERRYLAKKEQLESKERDLEARYLKKAEELETEERAWQKSTHGNPEERITEQIKEEEAIIIRIEGVKVELEEKVGSFNSTREGIKSRFKQLKEEAIKKYDKDKGAEMEDIKRIEGDVRAARENFDSERGEAEKRFEGDRSAFRHQLEERNKRIIGDIKEGKNGQYGRFTKQVEKFAQAMALLDDLSAIYIDRERTKCALRAIRSGSYKNWCK